MTSVVDRPDFPNWAISQVADFEAHTWQFKMCREHYEVSPGTYALIHNDDYDAMMHEISNTRQRAKRAEELLRQWLNGHLDDGFKERVESHFDPEPMF